MVLRANLGISSDFPPFPHLTWVVSLLHPLNSPKSQSLRKIVLRSPHSASLLIWVRVSHWNYGASSLVSLLGSSLSPACSHAAAGRSF